MKVRLTMEFDIPETLYRDDDEDKHIKPEKLPGHHISFVRDNLWRNFVHYSLCCHLEDSLEYLFKEKQCEDEPLKPMYKDISNDHKQWANIIKQAGECMTIEPVSTSPTLEDFKKEFDEKLANISDEELHEYFDIGEDEKIREEHDAAWPL